MTDIAKLAEGSRESLMVTLRRDESGKPTVWCDPEIADIVDALNNGKLSTVASCSGHGERPGVIALRDGRQLVVLDSLAEFKRVERHLLKQESSND